MPVEFLGIAGTNPASEVTPRPGGSLDLDYTRRLARAHEDHGWDRILFAYHSGSPDPAQVAAEREQLARVEDIDRQTLTREVAECPS